MAPVHNDPAATTKERNLALNALTALLALVRFILLPKRRPPPRTVIHVTAVELKPEDPTMVPPTTDHMPPLQLPSSTIRARLAVVDARKADGSRVTSVTWTSSNLAALPLEAIPDSTVKDAEGNEVLDPNDGQPLLVFSTFANTPLDEGEGLVTVRSPGMADCDIVVRYSDPPVGHFAITATEAPE